jgi:hypothetical protein
MNQCICGGTVFCFYESISLKTHSAWYLVFTMVNKSFVVKTAAMLAAPSLCLIYAIESIPFQIFCDLCLVMDICLSLEFLPELARDGVRPATSIIYWWPARRPWIGVGGRCGLLNILGTK